VARAFEQLVSVDQLLAVRPEVASLTGGEANVPDSDRRCIQRIASGSSCRLFASLIKPSQPGVGRRAGMWQKQFGMLELMIKPAAGS
jgi:hypothetical protein